MLVRTHLSNQESPENRSRLKIFVSDYKNLRKMQDTANPESGIGQTPAIVDAERARLLERVEIVVPLINNVRQQLGNAFETGIASVTGEQYRRPIRNIRRWRSSGQRRCTGGPALEPRHRRRLPGLSRRRTSGRELAATIASEQPRSPPAKVTVHYADSHTRKRGPNSRPGCPRRRAGSRRPNAIVWLGVMRHGESVHRRSDR